jgi:hypothetical protein
MPTSDVEEERTGNARPTAVTWARRPRVFTGRSDQPRSRRATDVLLLVGSGVGLVLLGAAAVPPAGIERAWHSYLRGAQLIIVCWGTVSRPRAVVLIRIG